MGPLDAVARHLHDAGVTFLFGVPGGGSNLDLVEASGRAGIRFVLTSSETGAALAAIGHAETSGAPGACLTTLGPGVASVVNGVACAKLDRAPLLVFTDAHASSGGFEHQRLDHRALLAPVTKWSAMLTASNADALMREALERATTEPRGPVHIECPADMTGSRGDHGGASASSAASGDSASLLDPALLSPLFARARKPLLLAGLGARRPLDAGAVQRLCASHNIPAMVTYKAKGVVPDTHPNFAGVFTHGTIEQPIVSEADLLVGVGLDPVELLPRAWHYEQPVVNIGPCAVDGGHIPFTAQLVCDVPSGMQLAGELLQRGAWDLDAVHRTVVEQRQRLCPGSARLTAHRVVQVAADVTARLARVTVDAGAHMFPATMLWPVSAPNGMLISNGLSTMGFALPAAIGAALVERDGAPGAIHDHDSPVVVLTGDGGLLMCVGELLTAVREQLRIIVIVFSDASLSLIGIKQRQRHLAAEGVALGVVSWSSLATGFGAAAHCARTEPELERALVMALEQRGPTVIEAIIDPSTYPETLRAVRG